MGSTEKEGLFIDRDCNYAAVTQGMEACFTAFDKDCDDNLNLKEFETLCRALFRDGKDESYDIDRNHLEQIFQVFDKNNNGLIDREEFVSCWNDWIKIIVKPVSAIVVVDVQNDFISGSLDVRKCPASQNGEEIVDPINNLLEKIQFEAIFYSLDWHPIDHVSFIENVHSRPIHESSPISADNAKVFDTVIFDGDPPIKQRLWPKHCVQNSWGAELHNNLKVAENAIKIYKGTNPDIDSYSVFWDNMKLSDTKLDAHLRANKITDVYICGLAYDVCVGATAADALSSGYRTILMEDCCRGVDLLSMEQTKQHVLGNHGVVVSSKEVPEMVSGNNRRPELGYQLAMTLKKKK
ncbi:nicotinamidase [Harmonia axyridis]|uniref:nicotinamidase n=1 Tax=Harmonia axyridis TaxID=115357 RepID=UPI001E276934|nr:nicotinamidase [Harmonia axyridis]